MLARNRQEMIANELSRLAGDEYLEDIMQHMRHMEVSVLKLPRPAPFLGPGLSLPELDAGWYTELAANN